MIEAITGLTVAYKAEEYVKLTIESLRVFYKELPIIIVNGSPEDDPCSSYCDHLDNVDPNIKLINLGKNCSHGISLNIGMKSIRTPYVYIFDSDVEMKRPGMLESMLAMINPDMYGIGFINFVGRNGGGSRTIAAGHIKRDGDIVYLHPFACLISTETYRKFPKFNFYGAPFIETCLAINDAGLDDGLLKYFPVKDYVNHYSGGTRAKYGDWPGHNKSPILDNLVKDLNEYYDLP